MFRDGPLPSSSGTEDRGKQLLKTETSSFWLWGSLCPFQVRGEGMQPNTKGTQEIGQEAENQVQLSGVPIYHSGLQAALSLLPLAPSFPSVFLFVSTLWKSRSFLQKQKQDLLHSWHRAPFSQGSISRAVLCRAVPCASPRP